MSITTVQTRYGFKLQATAGSFFVEEIQRSQGNPFYVNGVGTYEHHESEKVCSIVRPGDYCIDAGAHVGYFTVLMATCGGRVLAIEPNPVHFENLDRNVDGLNVVVSHMALSDTTSDGQAIPFFQPTPFDDGCGSLVVGDRNREIKVCTSRLDHLLQVGSIVEPRWLGKIRLLKMDIEGGESAALRGLGERLRDVEHVLIECGPGFGQGNTDGINEALYGWKCQRCGLGEWKQMPRALPDGNYLFTNPGTSL